MSYFGGAYTAGIVLNNPTQNPVTIGATASVSNTFYQGDVLYGTTAAAWNITNLGTISGAGASADGVHLAAGGTIDNAAATAFISGYADGVRIGGTYGTVGNSGTIAGTGTSSTGVELTAGGVVTNASGGVIQGAVHGVYIYGGAGTITNYGSIAATGGFSFGIDLRAGGVVSNASTSGLITGYKAVYAYGATTNVTNLGTIDGTGTGVSLSAGTLSNTASGIILGGRNGVAVGTYEGAGGYASSISNFGTITATGTGAYGSSYGIKGNPFTGPTPLTVTNYGTITATGSGGFGIKLAAGGYVSNAAGTAQIYGYRSGIVISGATAGTISNLGTIVGRSGDGIDLYGGYVTSGLGGFISGGNSYGVYAQQSATIVNAGSIAGIFEAGIKLQAGGTIVNAVGGAIYSRNRGVEAYGVATVSNYGSIASGVYLTQGGTVLDAGTIAATSFGTAIYFGGTGGNRLILDPGYTISGAVVVSGTAGTLELGSAASTGTVTGLGTSFVNFATITVDAGASWVLAGSNTIGAGVTLSDLGTLTNTGSLTGTGSLVVDPASLVNSGYIGLTVTLSGGGYLDNQSSGTLVGRSAVYGTGGPGTVVNSGTIAGAGGGTEAIYLKAGGTIFNGAGGATGALIDAYPVAIESSGSAVTVTNLGTIAGFGSGSDALYLKAGASVTNGASGTGEGLIETTGFNAVRIDGAAGTVTNYGTIVSTGTLGYGIVLTAGGTIDNSGLIAGGFDGVYAGGGAVTLTNAGTIVGSSGVAVSIGGGGDRVIVDPGAVFTGTVDDTGGGTLELAASATNGTLTGIGSSFTNFGTVTVDAGAQWTLTGSNTIGSGVTLTDLGTLTNTGSLTGAGSLVVDPASLVNSGYIGLTVSLTGGGYLDNTATGTIAAAGDAVYATGAPGTVVNAGTITGSGAAGLGVKLTAGGTVTNDAATALIGGYTDGVYIAGAGGVVGNLGTIESTGTPSSGVYLIAGGLVSNGASSATSALIAGYDGIRIAGPQGTVVNFATVATTGSAFGAQAVDFLAGGTVTNYGTFLGLGTDASGINAGFASDVIINGTGGLIAGWLNGIDQFSGTGTVVNSGTVLSTNGDGVYLQAGGSVSNAASGMILGYTGVAIAGGAGTVDNLGTINVGGGEGINLAAGGSVGNSGVISATGYGVFVGGAAGTVVNSGTVTSVGDGHWGIALTVGTVTNLSTGSIYAGVSINGGTVINAGSIARPNNDGVHLGAGLVSNSGIISGSIGVDVYSGPGTVSNSGTIAATGSAGTAAIALDAGGTVGNSGTIEAAGSAAIGVYLNSATLTNSGTIASVSGTAVALAGAGDLVVVEPTATFGGAITGFVAGDTLDFASVAASNYAFGGGVLTLFNGGTATATLALSTPVSNPVFVLGTDGSGGTLVTVSPGTGSTSGIVLKIPATQNPTVLAATVYVTNTTSSYSGDAVYGTNAAAWKLTNYGTINATGSLSSGVQLVAGGDVINGATNVTGAFIAGIYHGVYIGGISGTVENFGTIEAAAYAGVRLFGGTVTNYGTISALGTAHAGVAVLNSSGTVFNYGVIQAPTAGSGIHLHAGGSVTNAASATIAGYANGVLISGGRGTVANSGTIASTATTSAAVQLQSGGSVTNGTGGVLDGGATGVLVSGGTGTVANAGKIQSTGTTAGVGVYFGQGGTLTNQAGGLITAYRTGVSIKGAAGTVTNYGSIASTGTYFSAVYLGAGGIVANAAGGVIQGRWNGVNLKHVAGTVTNLGAIVSTANFLSPGGFHGAAVLLQQGGLLINGATSARGALITAYEFGAYIGGAAGVPNPGATGTVVNYGTIASTAAGALAVPTIELSSGGTISNYGTIDSAASLAVNIRGTVAGTVANFGLIENFTTAHAAIYSRAGGIVTNAAGATIASPRTAISFNDTAGPTVSFGSVDNSGTIASTATGTVGSGVYFGQGGALTNRAGGLIAAYRDAVVAKNASASVANYGTLASTGTVAAGVYLGAGGSVTNTATGMIQGAYDGVLATHAAATVVNSGTVVGTGTTGIGVYLKFGGSVTNLSGGTIVGGIAGVEIIGNPGIVSNSGTIENGLISGEAVYLAAGGIVTNASSSSLIAGSPGGLDIARGAGSVSNLGTIEGVVNLSDGGSVNNASTGVIQSSYAGVQISTNAGTVSNAGTIESTVVSGRDGVALQAGGIVSNTYTGALIAGVYNGVYITGGAGTVSNVGTIMATGSLGVGVFLLGAGSTLTNAGTIDGSSGAVAFVGAGNRLIVDPGAVFAGQINGGGGGNDVLELAGSATGTLGGLGTNVTGFDQVAIDPSAVWLLSGANTLASGATLANAGTFEIGGSLGVAGSVANSGVIDIEPGATLTLANGAGGAGSIDFVGTGTLEIDGATMPANPIDSFLAGDAIDLRNLSFGSSSGASFNAGTQVLTVTGGNGSDPLTLGGVAPGAVFTVTNDGGGGSLVTPASPDLINGLGGTAGFGAVVSGQPNDDGSSPAIDISSAFPGGLDFFGTVYDSLYINTNGNITFAAPLPTFTPSALTDPTITNPIIAPYWADVDTRGGAGVPTGGNATGSDLVYYALDTTNHVLTVTWDDVGYFSAQTDKLDAFQLQLIGTGGGNFDIVFRYQAITWTTGGASGGIDGLGGTVSRAGYNSGTGTSFELPQSGNQTAMLDLPFTPAPSGTLGATTTPGVYVFDVRNGVVVTSANLFDFVFTYADGKDYYFGTVADDGTLGYHIGQTITTTAGGSPLLGTYTIYAENGLATGDPVGTVRIVDYSHSGVGVASPVPVATAAGQPDGTQGLGSESDNVLGTDGQLHPFSSTLEPSFTANALYGFVFTYADGTAFYSGTVADDGSFGVTPGTRTLGNGTYTIFAEGLSARAAGTVVVDRFTENGTSYIPNGSSAVAGSGGLGSEASSLFVDGINFAFSDQLEPVLPSTIVRVPAVQAPSTSDVITAELDEVYSEVLGRNPDSGGLATYSADLANGTSLATIRQAIATSSEAQGDLNALYLQIFGRNIDPSGQATYTNLLIDGGSLATVQLTIAQSPEAQSDIQQIYQQVLARPADGGGLATYTAALASLSQPFSIAEVRGVIAHSSEAQNDLGSLFQSAIGRAPVAAELAGMEDQLAMSGTSQQTLASALQTGGAAAAGYVTITAPTGNATLTAQPLTPTLFDFTNPGFGSDTVAGFAPSRDTIELAATLVANFTTLQGDIANTTSGASITLGSHSILISGVASTNLGATNFLFA